MDLLINYHMIAPIPEEKDPWYKKFVKALLHMKLLGKYGYYEAGDCRDAAYLYNWKIMEC